MGWFVVTILVPLGVPSMFMLLAKLIPLPAAARARTKLITLVQDGQLGWVALGYVAACTYDDYTYLAKAGDNAVYWAAPVLGMAIMLIAASALMATLGALFPYDVTQVAPTSFRRALKQYSTFVGTFIAMLFAMAICSMVHYQLTAST